ncbi:MAG TPA: response regulator [Chthonomonadaceae bacterium]|nr:response regulator [Chthonomonadaceae bacterium]
MSKKRILFVDDEVNVLQGLQRMLHVLRHEWEMQFVNGGHAALDLLRREYFHVIVTDMRMPGMNGVELLTEVMKRHPHMVRIMLSGHAAQEDLLRSVGPTHQFLSKPCDADTLKSTIARACALRDLMANPPLQKLVTRMDTLPILPSLYTEMLQTIQLPDASIRAVGDIIGKDVAMTAKILQLVNSAFFGLPRRVSNPAQAVILLGLDTIRALVLSFHVFSQWDQKAQTDPRFLESLWRHSLAVGRLAKKISIAQTKDRHQIDDAFTAGLLHDVGQLVLAANLGPAYRKVQAEAGQERITLAAAERSLLGVTHAEVGAYLMGLWGLPDSIIEALAFHHRPADSGRQEFGPLTAVHVANCLEMAAAPESLIGVAPPIDHAYLESLGLIAFLPEWEDLYLTMSRMPYLEEKTPENRAPVRCA